MYAKVIDGELIKYPYSIAELRLENPNVSFSNSPNVKTLEAFDIVIVEQLPPGEFDPLTQQLIPAAPIFDGDKWTCGWDISNRPEEAAAAAIKDRRNKVLATTDWIVTKSLETNQPVPSNYVVYRQSLRDLPDQEGFPFDVEWPVLSS